MGDSGFVLPRQTRVWITRGYLIDIRPEAARESPILRVHSPSTGSPKACDMCYCNHLQARVFKVW